MEKALGDSKYRAVHGVLADLHGKLRRRVDVAKAILEAQQASIKTTQAQKLNSAMGRLQQAVATVEKDVSRYPNGKNWLPYVHADELKTVVEKKSPTPELLETVKINLAGRSTLADESQREFLHRASFVTLERAIDGVLEASTQKDPASYVQELQKIGAALMSALEEFEIRAAKKRPERFAKNTTPGKPPPRMAAPGCRRCFANTT